jgi:hypothetical protein
MSLVGALFGLNVMTDLSPQLVPKRKRFDVYLRCRRCWDYCRQKELPHPGIVVLDSPLLSYRDPLTSRHGELDADEKEVKDSGLKEHFYKFLVDQNDQMQFVIIENDPPPIALGEKSMVTLFVGSQETGERRGLY